jgi:amino acid transporter
MTDTAVGYAIIGIGILVVLGVIFALASRGGAPPRPRPPRGVHLPPPSYLPVVFSVAAALLGAGLAFRPEDLIVNAWIAVPGLVLLVVAVVAWVRAANHEWRDVEHGSHDDGPAH